MSARGCGRRGRKRGRRDMEDSCLQQPKDGNNAHAQRRNSESVIERPKRRRTHERVSVRGYVHSGPRRDHSDSAMAVSPRASHSRRIDCAKPRVEETDIGRVLFRKKQIAKFKADGDYLLFRRVVDALPTAERRVVSLRSRTPDPSQKLANRRFKGQMTAWRKAVHAFANNWRKNNQKDTVKGESVDSMQLPTCGYAEAGSKTVSVGASKEKQTSETAMFKCFECEAAFDEYLQLETHECKPKTSVTVTTVDTSTGGNGLFDQSTTDFVSLALGSGTSESSVLTDATETSSNGLLTADADTALSALDQLLSMVP